MFETIRYESEDGVATVTLDRPAVKNAISNLMIEEFATALEVVSEEDDVRVLLVTGAGDTFSSGYDLGESGATQSGHPTVEAMLDRYDFASTIVDAVVDLDVPAIAAVEGYALAGGCDLACACDLTIASDTARFGYPGVRMGGLPPSLIYPYVMNNFKQVRELLYTGKVISAERAEHFGMVNRIVPSEDLHAEVATEIDEIKKVPKPVVRLLKHSLNNVMHVQGFGAATKNNEFLDTLAHLTEDGKRWFEIRDEQGVNAAIEWMNEVDK